MSNWEPRNSSESDDEIASGSGAPWMITRWLVPRCSSKSAASFLYGLTPSLPFRRYPGTEVDTPWVEVALVAGPPAGAPFVGAAPEVPPALGAGTDEGSPDDLCPSVSTKIPCSESLCFRRDCRGNDSESFRSHSRLLRCPVSGLRELQSGSHGPQQMRPGAEARQPSRSLIRRVQLEGTPFGAVDA